MSLSEQVAEHFQQLGEPLRPLEEWIVGLAVKGMLQQGADPRTLAYRLVRALERGRDRSVGLRDRSLEW